MFGEFPPPPPRPPTFLVVCPTFAACQIFSNTSQQGFHKTSLRYVFQLSFRDYKIRKGLRKVCKTVKDQCKYRPLLPISTDMEVQKSEHLIIIEKLKTNINECRCHRCRFTESINLCKLQSCAVYQHYHLMTSSHYFLYC